MLPKNTNVMPLVNHLFIADALYNIADALWFNSDVQGNINLICKQMDEFVRNDYGDGKLSISTYCVLAQKSGEAALSEETSKEVAKEIAKVFHLTSAFYSGKAGLSVVGSCLKMIHTIMNGIPKTT